MVLLTSMFVFFSEMLHFFLICDANPILGCNPGYEYGTLNLDFNPTVLSL